VHSLQEVPGLTCVEEESEFEPVPLPYLPAAEKAYTLVLDLDETLIHYDEQAHTQRHEQTLLSFQTRYGRPPNAKELAQISPSNLEFIVRPHCHTFLREMSRCFEVVVFTAGEEDYANEVLDRLDKDNCVSHRLYRQHTTFRENTYIKDLSRLGRSLDRIIIIDNLAENFQL
jgi:CTD small phosphatase-like protein 2